MSPHPDSPIAPDPAGIVEQRLFLRKKVEAPLPIELLPGKEVWLYDLSEGGLSVSGSSRVEPGTTAYFDFEFPDPNSVIEAAGVVAWCDNSGRVGVRFTRIKPDSTAALKRWLKSDQSAITDQKVEPPAQITPLSGLVSRAHFEISDLRTELGSKTLTTETALKLIVERMAYHTRATGAAIAWRVGSDVICRANTGNAPEIGVRLNIDTGLSGECYRTGNIVSLADSEHDSRVDPQVCRQLDFRSLLIVPVASADETIVGVAEVFSSTPGNFEGGDVLLLSSIAELIGDLYDKSSSATCSVSDIAPSSLATQAHGLVDSALQEDAGSAQNESSSAPFVPTGFELAHEELEIIPTQGSSGRIENAPGNDRPESQSRGYSSWKSRCLLFGAFLLAGTYGVGAYTNWRFVHRQPAAPHLTQTISQPAAVSAPIAESSDSPTVVAPESPINLQATTAVPNRNLHPKEAPRDESVYSNFSTGLAAHLPRPEPAPVPPALLASNQAPFRVDTTYFLRNNVPQVKLLKASLPASEVTKGRLLRRVDPVFPQFAKTAGIRGSVVIGATIGKDGRLKNMKLISGNGALAIEAFRAARQWVYAPYRLNGQPIEVDARIVMDFGRNQ